MYNKGHSMDNFRWGEEHGHVLWPGFLPIFSDKIDRVEWDLQD